MSKRLLTLITVLLLLVVSSVVHGQEPTTDEPIFVLTEEQINAEFTIPSTAARTISNLDADVQSDGVHISFDLTTRRNGTTTTQGIIAILIGQVQENRTASNFYDLLISRHVLEDAIIVSRVTAPSSVQREVNRLVGRAWRNYVRDAFAGVDVSADHIEIYSLEMDDDAIYVYGTEGVTAQWCLECSHE